MVDGEGCGGGGGEMDGKQWMVDGGGWMVKDERWMG